MLIHHINIREWYKVWSNLVKAGLHINYTHDNGESVTAIGYLTQDF